LYRINIGMLSEGSSIPVPFYKQSEKKDRHDVTSSTGDMMSPHGVTYEESSPGRAGGDIIPPKPSVREPSKETTQQGESPLSAKRNGNGCGCFSLFDWEGDGDKEIEDKGCELFGMGVGD
jgi:hypothetical protein